MDLHIVSPQSARRALASAMGHEEDHMVYGLSCRNASAEIVSIDGVHMRDSNPATVTRSEMFLL